MFTNNDLHKTKNNNLLSGVPWWLCELIRTPVHATHDYQKGWGSTPSHAGKKCVKLLSVHALRLISLAGKRVQWYPL